MARNGSGTYSLPENTWNPAVPDTTITAEDWNATATDLATALTQSLANDGQTTASARIPFAQGVSVFQGTETAPALSIIGDSNTGIYQPAADQLAITTAGVQALNVTTTGIVFALGLTIQDNLTVTGDVVIQGQTSLNGSVSLGNQLADPITVNGTTTFVNPIDGVTTFNDTPVVPDGSWANAKLANMATQTFKGRNTAGSGAPEDLTVTQATAMINAFVGDSGSGGTKGQVPAPASGDAAAGKVLGAGGGWVSAIAAQGAFTGSTGATLKARGISMSRSATGTYTVTLSPAMGDANYIVIPSFQDLNNVSYSVQSQLAGSFTLATVITGGAAVDPTKIFLTILA